MAEILKRFTVLDFILLGLNELFLVFVPILCGITPSSELGMAAGILFCWIFIYPIPGLVLGFLTGMCDCSFRLGIAGLLIGIVFGGAAIFIGDPVSIQNIISEGAWIPLICWMAGLGIGKFVSWFRS